MFTWISKLRVASLLQFKSFNRFENYHERGLPTSSTGLARFVCYDENVICATLVCASNFCPFFHISFSRTSGVNSILIASKSLSQRCGVMKG